MKRNELKKIELNYYEEKLVVASLVKLMREANKINDELCISQVSSLLRKLEN